MKYRATVCLLLLLFFPFSAISIEPVQEIIWDDLLPPDYNPAKVFEKFGDVSKLSDNDPRAIQMLKELEKFWGEAPIVESMDGKRVKLPGFVVPLEGDGKTVSEFLLVPYYGACIHVPPPPSNQIVYVNLAKGDAQILKAFDTVWVTGTMNAKPFTSNLATAGYRMRGENITPYK